MAVQARVQSAPKNKVSEIYAKDFEHNSLYRMYQLVQLIPTDTAHVGTHTQAG